MATASQQSPEKMEVKKRDHHRTEGWIVQPAVWWALDMFLVGGLVAIFGIFPWILGVDYHPNWRTYIFQRGGPGPPTRYFLEQHFEKGPSSLEIRGLHAAHSMHHSMHFLGQDSPTATFGAQKYGPRMAERSPSPGLLGSRPDPWPRCIWCRRGAQSCIVLDSPGFFSEMSVGGFRLVMGVPNSWMVYFMENPNLKWMRTFGVPPYDLGNLQMFLLDPAKEACWA